jgi:hypothetical protein
MNPDSSVPPRQLLGVALISATLLMIELALRIFSVVICTTSHSWRFRSRLRLSASGVFTYLARRRLDAWRLESLLSTASIVCAACTIVAFFSRPAACRLNYSPTNLALMLTIYALAALPFFTAAVITLAVSRPRRINAVYAADLMAPPPGCLV